MSIDLAAIVLGLLLLLPVWIMYAAHKETGFSWGQMLRDTDNKSSAVRIGVPISLAVSSYGAMYVMVKWPPADALKYHTLFLAIWSSTLVVSKIIDRWDGRLPFAKIPPVPGSQ